MTNDEDGSDGENRATFHLPALRLRLRLGLRLRVESWWVGGAAQEFFILSLAHELANGTDSTPWVSGFESARGLAHSKTLRDVRKRRPLLEVTDGRVGVHTPDDKVLTLCPNTGCWWAIKGTSKSARGCPRRAFAHYG